MKQNRPSIGGKMPLSTKSERPVSLDALFGNRFDVPLPILEDIKSKNQECRFVSVRELDKGMGMHLKKWVVYKMPEAVRTELGSLWGGSADGTYRLGDSILAVRPKELCENHRRALSHKAKGYAQEFYATQKKTIIEDTSGRQTGLKVEEGFD